MTKPTKKRTVSLRLAYAWTCPDCEHVNYDEAAVAEMTKEDVADFMQEFGGKESDWRTGEWMVTPEDVECDKCGTGFRAEALAG